MYLVFFLLLLPGAFGFEFNHMNFPSFYSIEWQGGKYFLKGTECNAFITPEGNMWKVYVETKAMKVVYTVKEPEGIFCDGNFIYVPGSEPKILWANCGPTVKKGKVFCKAPCSIKEFNAWWRGNYGEAGVAVFGKMDAYCVDGRCVSYYGDSLDINLGKGLSHEVTVICGDVRYRRTVNFFPVELYRDYFSEKEDVVVTGKVLAECGDLKICIHGNCDENKVFSIDLGRKSPGNYKIKVTLYCDGEKTSREFEYHVFQEEERENLVKLVRGEGKVEGTVGGWYIYAEGDPGELKYMRSQLDEKLVNMLGREGYYPTHVAIFEKPVSYMRVIFPHISDKYFGITDSGLVELNAEVIERKAVVEARNVKGIIGVISVPEPSVKKVIKAIIPDVHLDFSPGTLTISGYVKEDLGTLGSEDVEDKGKGAVRVRIYKDDGDGDFNAEEDVMKVEKVTNSSGFYYFYLRNPTWWNTSWQYRRLIEISNPNDYNLTNYQVRLFIDTNSLISSGKMRSDCGDIRFIDSLGNLLPYWVKEGCDTNNTEIWVKVPFIVANGTADIWMYYGNSSATSLSDPDTVFQFFDDMSNGSAKWVSVTGLWRITDATDVVNGVPEYHSEYNAWAYNRKATHTYATGARTYGGILSTAFTLEDNSCLEFWEKLETEQLTYQDPANQIYDNAYVQLRIGATTYTLRRYTGYARWHKKTVSLAGYSGTAQLRFYFDSRDGYYNNYEGWIVDDIIVRKCADQEPEYLVYGEDTYGETLDGNFFVVVNSRDIFPEGWTGGAVQPEETYHCDYNGSAHVCSQHYGGRDRWTTDDWDNGVYEHVAKVVVPAEDVTITDINFLFAFNLVVNALDHGQGSLRQAIENISASEKNYIVVFDLSTADPNYNGYTWTIPLESELPILTGSAYIDGADNVILDANGFDYGFFLADKNTTVKNFEIRDANKGVIIAPIVFDMPFGEKYLRIVDINNSLNSKPLLDYQVKIILDTASLISSGKMRSDCGDIRFVDPSTGEKIPYWIRRGTCNTTSTEIWVKVPRIPALGIKKIWLYYGNLSLTSESNGDEVFDFYDDFESGNIDTNKWTTFQRGGVTPPYWVTDSTVFYEGSYSARSKTTVGNRQAVGIETNVYLPCQGIVEYWWRVYSDPTDDTFDFYVDDDLKHKISGSVAWEERNSVLEAGTRKLTWLYGTNWIYIPAGDGAWLDLVRVRKYVPPEPVTSVGSELTFQPNPENTLIENVTVREANYGIYVYNTDYPTMHNIFGDTNITSILLEKVYYGDVNIAQATGVEGIVLKKTNNTTLKDLYVYAVEKNALVISESNSITIQNAVVDDAERAAVLTDVNDVNMSEIRAKNVKYGIYVDPSSNVTINGFQMPPMPEYPYITYTVYNPNNYTLYGKQVKIEITDPTVLQKMASDGRDIRVFSQYTDSPYTSTTGKLPYWVQEIGPLKAVLWTKVDLPPESETKIYIYYGNMSATPESNYTAVFTPSLPDSNIMIWWEFDEGEGEYTKNLAARPEWVSGHSGSALRFFGNSLAGTWVEIPDSPWLQVSSGLTMEAWVYWDGTPSFGDVINKEGSYALAVGTDGSLYWAINTRNIAWTFVDTGFDLNANTWYHIAVTYDGSTVVTYVNGTLVQNYSYAGGDVRVSNAPLGIGARYGSSGNYWTEFFNGIIDEVRIYSRPLSASEVSQRYSGADVNTGLEGWWKFDEGVGTYVWDSSGRGNNGFVHWGDAVLKQGTDWNGLAWEFNGSTDYAVAPNVINSDANQPFSISAWVYVKTSTSTQDQYAVSITGRAGIRTHASGTPDYGVTWWYTDSTSDGLSTGTSILNSWHHIALVFDGSTMHLYLDGTEVNSAPISKTLASGQYITLGALSSSYGFVPEVVDSVRIYNRALAPSEVNGLASRPDYTRTYQDPIVYPGKLVDFVSAYGIELNNVSSFTISNAYIKGESGIIIRNSNNGSLTNVSTDLVHKGISFENVQNMDISGHSSVLLPYYGASGDSAGIYGTDSFDANALACTISSYGWKYVKKVNVRNNTSEPWINVPVYLELNSSNFNFEHARGDGKDIAVFASVDGQMRMLRRWITEWDSSNENGEIVVEIPYLDANTDVNIYLYYGSPFWYADDPPDFPYGFSDDFSEDPETSGKWTVLRATGDTVNEANWDGEKIYLTKNVNYKATAIIANYEIKSRKWVATFRYYAGGGTGADGLVFQFYKSWYTYISLGGGLGWGGYGYGLEIDNYRNGFDPSANHFAVIKDTVSNHLTYVNDARTEDGIWHDARVEFDYNTVRLYIDGSLVLSYTGIDDINYYRIGFSAGTGGLNNYHIIDDFRFKEQPVDPEITYYSEVRIDGYGVNEINVDSSTTECNISNVYFGGYFDESDNVGVSFNGNSEYGVYINGTDSTVNADLNVLYLGAQVEGSNHNVSADVVVTQLASAPLKAGNYYFTPVLIENQEQNLIDYQIKIVLKGKEVIDHIYGGDIRVFSQYTDSPYTSTTGKLPYWVQETGKDRIALWTKLSLRPYEREVIYVYYGNPSATSESNFDAVFTKDPDAPEDDGLIAEYHFDEGAGTTAYDDAGSHNGTVYGAVWEASDGGEWDGEPITFSTGSALRFDGIDDNITVPDSPDLSPQATGDLSICAWVYVLNFNTDTHPQPREPIVAKGYTGEWEYALYVYDSGKVGFSLWQCSGASYAEVYGGEIDTNEWHYVCGVYSKDNYVIVYLDGKAVGYTTTFTGSPCDGTRPLKIGAREDGQFLNAIIDEVRIYNKALSPGDILAYYERRRPAEHPPSVFSDTTVGIYARGSGHKVNGNVSAGIGLFFVGDYNITATLDSNSSYGAVFDDVNIFQISGTGSTEKACFMGVDSENVDIEANMLCGVSGVAASTESSLNVKGSFSGYWLTGWKYRLPITVTNQNDYDLEDYPIQILLHRSDADFYLFNSDGSDIRFTTTTGEKIPYWVEYWATGVAAYYTEIELNNPTSTNFVGYPLRIVINNSQILSHITPDARDVRFFSSYVTDPYSTDANELPYWVESRDENALVVWVKTDLPAGSTKTIYMYYGNPYAASESNGSAVFTYFDDFSTRTTSSYTYAPAEYQGTSPFGYWEAPEYMHLLLRTSSGRGFAEVAVPLGQRFAIEARAKNTFESANEFVGVGIDGAGADVVARFGTDGLFTIEQITPSGISTLASTTYTPDTEFHRLALYVDGVAGTLSAVMDGTPISALGTASGNPGMYAALDLNSNVAFDWFFVREWAPAEQSVTYTVKGEVDPVQARIWIKIPVLPAGQTETIYLYYGNSSATSESNQTAVCPYYINGKCYDFYDDFSTDPSLTWTIYRYAGDPLSEAYWDGNVLYLTTATNSRGAAVYAPVRLTRKAWAIEFNYLAGGGTGADGMVFMFYKQEAPAASGGALGWKGTGYGFEIDNYQNGWDPSANHFAIISGTYENHLTYVNDARTEDGIWHRVKFIFQEGRILVYIDGSLLMNYYIKDVDYTYDLFGFGAGTGGLNNNHIIDDVKLYAYATVEPVVSVGGGNSYGLLFENSGSIDVNADIKHFNVGTLLYNTNNTTIHDSEITYNSSHGLVIYGSANEINGVKIAENGGSGIIVFEGNANIFTQVSLSNNEKLGIDLGGDGVTPNDGALSSGPNDYVDYPVITSAQLIGPTTLHVQGYVNTEGAGSGSPVFAGAVVEIYGAKGDFGDTYGGKYYGEGWGYVGALTVDATGAFDGNLEVPASVLSALTDVTGLTRMAQGTSEFGPNRAIEKPVWAYIYGSLTPLSGYILGSEKNIQFLWQEVNANIFVTDVDCDVNIDAVEPLDETNGDFEEADLALGLYGRSDSITNLWDSNGDGLPDNTRTYVINGRTVANVPVVWSTPDNNGSFWTGLLYDPEGKAYYDGTQCLIFITETNNDQTGGFGGPYDYEIRIPISLPLLKGTNNQIKVWGEVID